MLKFTYSRFWWLLLIWNCCTDERRWWFWWGIAKGHLDDLKVYKWWSILYCCPNFKLHKSNGNISFTFQAEWYSKLLSITKPRQIKFSHFQSFQLVDYDYVAFLNYEVKLKCICTSTTAISKKDWSEETVHFCNTKYSTVSHSLSLPPIFSHPTVLSNLGPNGHPMINNIHLSIVPCLMI